jgi:hypothetical protein
MSRHSPRLIRKEENEVKHMWKLVIIVCALGNPCVIMQEDPMRHYTSKSECMANASVKHSDIVEAYPTYGYQVDKSSFDCIQVDGLTNS